MNLTNEELAIATRELAITPDTSALDAVREEARDAVRAEYADVVPRSRMNALDVEMLELKKKLDQYYAGAEQLVSEAREEATKENMAQIAMLVEVLSELVQGIKPEINEKGAGGFLLARLSDAEKAIAVTQFTVTKWLADIAEEARQEENARWASKFNALNESLAALQKSRDASDNRIREEARRKALEDVRDYDIELLATLLNFVPANEPQIAKDLNDLVYSLCERRDRMSKGE